MAEIIFRLPSKKIQYGYVEVHATPDELGLNLSDAVDLGVVYSNYAASFMEGEVMGVDAARAARGLPPKPEGQKPPGKPVDGVSGVSQVPSDEQAAEVVKEVLGATEVEGDAPPWERSVAPKTKPWENDSKPAVDVDLGNLF